MNFEIKLIKNHIKKHISQYVISNKAQMPIESKCNLQVLMNIR
jgi:hypothetical protein